MSLWRYRNFRLLFARWTISSLGDGLTPVALAFAVLGIRHSARDLGLVLGAQSLALVGSLIPGGLIADRFPRRAVMMVADSVRTASQGLLGALFIAGRPAMPTVVALAAVGGAAAALAATASTGLLPSLVSTETLQQANAIKQSTAGAAGIAGPALAGVLVATVGAGWALVGDSASFAFSVLMLALIQVGPASRALHQNVLADIRDGWEDFWSRRWFRSVVGAFVSVRGLCRARPDRE